MSKEKIEKCDDERESSSTLLLEKQKTKQTHSHTRVDDDGDGGARSLTGIYHRNEFARVENPWRPHLRQSLRESASEAFETMPCPR